MKVKQFNYDCISDYMYDGRRTFLFNASMISTCAPLFDDCDSNNEVEEKLKKANVILSTDKADSESCAMYINFSSRKFAENFIDRLNAYLLKKVELLKEAYNF